MGFRVSSWEPRRSNHRSPNSSHPASPLHLATLSHHSQYHSVSGHAPTCQCSPNENLVSLPSARLSHSNFSGCVDLQRCFQSPPGVTGASVARVLHTSARHTMKRGDGSIGRAGTLGADKTPTNKQNKTKK